MRSIVARSQGHGGRKCLGILPLQVAHLLEAQFCLVEASEGNRGSIEQTHLLGLSAGDRGGLRNAVQLQVSELLLYGSSRHSDFLDCTDSNRGSLIVPATPVLLETRGHRARNLQQLRSVAG